MWQITLLFGKRRYDEDGAAGSIGAVAFAAAAAAAAAVAVADDDDDDDDNDDDDDDDDDEDCDADGDGNSGGNLQRLVDSCGERGADAKPKPYTLRPNPSTRNPRP